MLLQSVPRCSALDRYRVGPWPVCPILSARRTVWVEEGERDSRSRNCDLCSHRSSSSSHGSAHRKLRDGGPSAWKFLSTSLNFDSHRDTACSCLRRENFLCVVCPPKMVRCDDARQACAERYSKKVRPDIRAREYVQSVMLT